MTTEQTTDTAGQTYPDDTSPDSLMGDFRGRPIIKILILTLLVHAVLIGVFSIGYLKEQLLGEDTSEMSKEQRIEVAVREATRELKKIADRHEMSVQELSDQFASGKPRPVTPPTTRKPVEPTTQPGGDPTKPESAIEKTLKTKTDGPDLPDLAPKEDDDLFK
ncbi:MAG: hypothetical protein HN350_18075 [Phycisphaerales bacterium]|jgi:hypothetical protein|nr:hypothetical protein [Phycisphaerales bacterium]